MEAKTFVIGTTTYTQTESYPDYAVSLGGSLYNIKTAKVMTSTYKSYTITIDGKRIHVNGYELVAEVYPEARDVLLPKKKRKYGN